MTITNHIQRIEELTNHVTVLVDAREYAQAHEALDEIEARAHAAHQHIDRLQLLNRQFLSTTKDE